MLQEARTETDRIKVDAQSRAEEARQAGKEALEKAKVEAQRMLAGLANRRENLVTQLQQMQSKLLTVAKDLEVSIEEPIQLDSPDEDEPEAADKPDEGEGARSESGPEVIDPRYEDLWVTSDTVDLPDLASIELDFEDETPKKSE
jgi:hypothetical protein